MSVHYPGGICLCLYHATARNKIDFLDISIELPDGSTVELENEAELDAIYEDFEDTDEELSFQFPITVLYDGVELNVSEAELMQ